MSNLLRKLLCALCIVAAPVFAVVVLPTWYSDAIAQEKEKKQDFSKVRTRRVPTLGKVVYDKLAKVQDVLEAEKNPRNAQRILDLMLREHKQGRTLLNSYELANVWNSYGYLYYVQEKYDRAIEAYEQVISDPTAVPAAMLTSTRFVIAQIFFVVERYDEAIARLNEWLASVKNPGPDVWFLLAQAYYQKEDRKTALEMGIKAYELAQKRRVKMRQSWYLLLRALYYEQEDYGKVIEILRQLVVGWPKREYWVQLAGMYGQQEQTHKQVIGLETAYLQDILTQEKEFASLAYLLIGQGMPYKAAKVMEFGLENEYVERTSKNLELYGSAWQSSREIERALPILEEAADLSDTGNIYARLASAYFDLHRFEDAIRVSEAALEKGDIKRADTLNIVLGMSLFNVEQFKKANLAFEAASKDERSESLANQWQVHIIREQRRLRQLAKEEKDPDLFDLLRGS